MRARFVVIAAFWTVLALMVAAQTWLSMISHGHSLARIAAFELAAWWGWGILTPGVFWLTRRAPVVPFRARNAFLHMAAALVIAVLHVALVILLMVSIQPYDDMTIDDFGPHFVPSLFARLPIEIVIYTSIVAVV